MLEGFSKTAKDCPDVDVFIAPTAVELGWWLGQGIIGGETGVGAAVQNVCDQPKGAFTGEIPALQLSELNVQYVLVGHSERRNVYNESFELCAARASQAFTEGRTVVFCIGEKKEDREGGTTMDRCQEQLEPFMALPNLDWEKTVIAYEPVWAIGTGLVATPEQAQGTHADIREYLKSHPKAGEEVANAVRIQYGGSVNAKNCAELSAQLDIDGFLVGGASLKPEFNDIIKSGQK